MKLIFPNRFRQFTCRIPWLFRFSAELWLSLSTQPQLLICTHHTRQHYTSHLTHSYTTTATHVTPDALNTQPQLYPNHNSHLPHNTLSIRPQLPPSHQIPSPLHSYPHHTRHFPHNHSYQYHTIYPQHTTTRAGAIYFKVIRLSEVKMTESVEDKKCVSSRGRGMCPL